MKSSAAVLQAPVTHSPDPSSEQGMQFSESVASVARSLPSEVPRSDDEMRKSDACTLPGRISSARDASRSEVATAVQHLRKEAEHADLQRAWSREKPSSTSQVLLGTSQNSRSSRQSGLGVSRPAPTSWQVEVDSNLPKRIRTSTSTVGLVNDALSDITTPDGNRDSTSNSGKAGSPALWHCGPLLRPPQPCRNQLVAAPAIRAARAARSAGHPEPEKIMKTQVRTGPAAALAAAEQAAIAAANAATAAEVAAKTATQQAAAAHQALSKFIALRKRARMDSVEEFVETEPSMKHLAKRQRPNTSLDFVESDSLLGDELDPQDLADNTKLITSASRHADPKHNTVHMKNDDKLWQVNIEAVYKRKDPKLLDRVPEMIRRYKSSNTPLNLLYRKVCQTYKLDPAIMWAIKETHERDDHYHGTGIAAGLQERKNDFKESAFGISSVNTNASEQAKLDSIKSSLFASPVGTTSTQNQDNPAVASALFSTSGSLFGTTAPSAPSKNSSGATSIFASASSGSLFALDLPAASSTEKVSATGIFGTSSSGLPEKSAPAATGSSLFLFGSSPKTEDAAGTPKVETTVTNASSSTTPSLFSAGTSPVESTEKPKTSLFSGPTPSTDASSSIFGPPKSTSGSDQQASSGSSLFSLGGAPSKPINSSSTNLFASSSTSSGTNLFASSSTSSSIFSVGAAVNSNPSDPVKNTDSIFNKTSGDSIFGQQSKSSLFDKSDSVTSSSIFGQTASSGAINLASSGSSIFSSSSATSLAASSGSAATSGAGTSIFAQGSGGIFDQSPSVSSNAPGASSGSSIFGSSPAPTSSSTIFGQSTGTSIFGSGSSASGIFGASSSSSATSPGQTSGSSLFMFGGGTSNAQTQQPTQSSQSASSSLFQFGGAAQPPSSGSGMFGQSSGSLFSQASSSGAFGQTPGGTSFGQSSGGNLFAQSSGANLFGASSSGSMFGSGSTGGATFAQSTGGSMFSQPQGSPFFGQGSSGSMFGQAAGGAAFGQTAGGAAFGQPSGGAAFGQASGGVAFGQPSGGAAFGQPSGGAAFGQPSGGNMFSSPPANPAFGPGGGGMFGSTPAFSSTPSPAGNMFGQSPVGGGFGQQPAAGGFGQGAGGFGPVPGQGAGGGFGAAPGQGFGAPPQGSGGMNIFAQGPNQQGQPRRKVRAQRTGAPARR